MKCIRICLDESSDFHASDQVTCSWKRRKKRDSIVEESRCRCVSYDHEEASVYLRIHLHSEIISLDTPTDIIKWTFLVSFCFLYSIYISHAAHS